MKLLQTRQLLNQPFLRLMLQMLLRISQENFAVWLIFNSRLMSLKQWTRNFSSRLVWETTRAQKIRHVKGLMARNFQLLLTTSPWLSLQQHSFNPIFSKNQMGFTPLIFQALLSIHSTTQGPHQIILLLPMVPSL